MSNVADVLVSLERSATSLTSRYSEQFLVSLKDVSPVVLMQILENAEATSQATHQSELQINRQCLSEQAFKLTTLEARIIETREALVCDIFFTEIMSLTRL